METITLNNNSVELYQLKRFTDFTSPNLNIKEKAIETLEFIQENIWKTLYNKDDCEDTSDYYRVSKYENSKIYEIPKVCFEEIQQIQQEEEYEEIEQNKITDFIKNLNLDLKTIFIIIQTFIIALTLLNTGTKANIQEIKQESPQEITIQNEFDILTQKSNKNTEVISQELQEQKRLRDLIQKSIQVVKTLEKENQDIRNTLLHKAQ